MFEVGLKLIKDLEKIASILAASAATEKNLGKNKASNDKCPKHTFIFIKSGLDATCIQNQRTEQVGKDASQKKLLEETLNQAATRMVKPKVKI